MIAKPMMPLTLCVSKYDVRTTGEDIGLNVARIP